MRVLDSRIQEMCLSLLEFNMISILSPDSHHEAHVSEYRVSRRSPSGVLQNQGYWEPRGAGRMARQLVFICHLSTPPGLARPASRTALGIWFLQKTLGPSHVSP